MHELYKQKNLPYLSVKLCPKCNQIISKKHIICPNCEYSFQDMIKKETPKPQVVATPANDVKVVEVSKQVEKPSDKIMFCENCGSRLASGTKYCGACGTKVARSFCPYCGEGVEDKQSFCSSCGRQVRKSPSVNKAQYEMPTNDQTVVSNPYNNQPTYQPFKAEEAKKEEVKPEETKVVEQPKVEETKVVEQPKVEETKVVEQPKVEEPKKEETQEAPANEEKKDVTNGIVDLHEFVNMGRKRAFLIIEFVVATIIMFFAAFIPIMNAGAQSFTANIIKLSTEAFKELNTDLITTGKLTNGYRLISYIINGFVSGNGLAAINNLPAEYLHIGSDIICAYPIGKFVLGDVLVNWIIVIFYALLVISYICVFFTALFGLFIKKPFRGKTLGTMVLVLALFTVFIYLQLLVKNWSMPAYGFYDSWVIYGFGLAFLVWFIIKLVFINEVKMFDKLKEDELQRKYNELDKKGYKK